MVEDAKYLIEAGAEVNYCDNCGKSVLMIAAGSESLDIVVLLIENGVNMEQIDKHGRDVFRYARNQPHILDYLNQAKEERAQLSTLQD